MKNIQLLATTLLLTIGTTFAKPPADAFTYLDNGTIRIGVDKGRGSARSSP